MYPLLGSKMNGWHFVASEVDSLNFETACQNVLKNNMQQSVKGNHYLEQDHYF